MLNLSTAKAIKVLRDDDLACEKAPSLHLSRLWSIQSHDLYQGLACLGNYKRFASSGLIDQARQMRLRLVNIEYLHNKLSLVDLVYCTPGGTNVHACTSLFKPPLRQRQYESGPVAVR